MSEEKMREKFERVVESKFGFDDNDFYFDKTDSTYNDPDLNDLWIVYQAALQESEAGAVRKAFICKSCGGVYADQPVSQCDCFPEKNEFTHAYICEAPPSAQAIEAAAIMKCVEVCRQLDDEPRKDQDYASAGDCIDSLLALITQDGRTQLEEFGMKCIDEASALNPRLWTEHNLRSIVTNMIGAAK